MLVLTRKTDERIMIGEGVELVVLSIRGTRHKPLKYSHVFC